MALSWILGEHIHVSMITHPEPEVPLPTFNLLELQHLAIAQAISKTKENLHEAAALLGINPSTLYRYRYNSSLSKRKLRFNKSNKCPSNRPLVQLPPLAQNGDVGNGHHILTNGGGKLGS